MTANNTRSRAQKVGKVKPGCAIGALAILGLLIWGVYAVFNQETAEERLINEYMERRMAEPAAEAPAKSYTADPPTTAYMPPSCTDWVEVSYVAEEIVKQRLRAPATADFPSSPDQWRITKEDGMVRVRSYVDAQNAFGATLRNTFDIILSCDGTTFKVVSCSLQ